MSFNKIIIVGNLGRNPQMNYTSEGKAVCQFSVATTEKRSSNGETKEETTWFQASCWGKLAEVAGKYLTKGKQVYLEGRLRTREWSKDGKSGTSLEVSVSELQLLGRNDSNSNSHSDTDADIDIKPPAKAAKASYSNTNNSTKEVKSSTPITTYSEDFEDDSAGEDDIPF